MSSIERIFYRIIITDSLLLLGFISNSNSRSFNVTYHTVPQLLVRSMWGMTKMISLLEGTRSSIQSLFFTCNIKHIVVHFGVYAVVGRCTQLRRIVLVWKASLIVRFLTSRALRMSWNHFFFDIVSLAKSLSSVCVKYPLK